MVTALKTIVIKPMGEADAQAVLTIYANSIQNEDVTFETELPSWSIWDKAHDPNCRLVACIDSKVVGFIVLSHVFTHPAYEGVAEISIYVNPNYRKQGVGYRLLSAMIPLSERFHYHMLQSRIFPSNIPSIKLHEKLGFRLIGYREKILKRKNVWRDVYVYERRSPLL